MDKTVAVIGTPGRVATSFARDTAGAFSEVGHNTGNLAFQHAVWSLIEDEKRAFPFDFDPAAVRDGSRLVCIPAANFLYSGFDLGGFAARLETTGLPLLVLGLGAQAFRNISEVKLQAGTERLLRLFAERCASILVRGRHTGAVLEKYDVHNFAVLGCPSNFINADPRLGARILERWRQARDLFAYAPTFYSYNADFERALYEGLEPCIAEVVAQDPLQAVALARGDRTAEAAAWLAEKAGFLSALRGEARAQAVDRLRAYFCAEAWLESYRRLDAVIGTRIHGVNLGWQAGRAALVASYDLRTEELAETMGIPMLKAADLAPERVVELMEERVETCAAGYDDWRRELARGFAQVLEAHGVKPSGGLRSLAGASVPASPAAETQTAVRRSAWGCLELHNR